MTFAYHAPSIFNRFGKFGDFSFGLYLYAFPIQQLFSNLGVNNFMLHISLSTMTAMVLAVISWRFIEEPALSLKIRKSTIKLSDAAAIDASRA